MEKIRILQVVPNMQQGGIENFIMNVYRNIDRNKIQFDFIVHYDKEFYFDKEIEALGGKIYHFPVMENKNIFKYIKDLYDFFEKHKEYKIIHGHMASLGFIYLGIAKKMGIPIRIAHSHGTSYLKNLKGYMKFLLFKLEKYQSNIQYACSTEAGRYLFGSRNFEIIPNAIDFKKFYYNIEVRNNIRKKLNLDKNFVIGHIGRFNLQKNHEFIIEVFSKVFEKNNKVKLLLIGTGELEDKIKKLVNIKGLNNNIIFLGNRGDVNELYQAMDLFIMPSLFEGLPVTGVEAQVSGLKCIFSNNITKEVDISNESMFLELNEEKWVNQILDKASSHRKPSSIIDSKFDIKNLSKIIEKKYEDYYGIKN